MVDYVCPVAVIVATATVLRFQVRERFFRAQGEESVQHNEELKGVLALHLGEAAEIANRLHRFLPDMDLAARPLAEESVRRLVSHLDTLTVILRDPDPER